MLYRLSVIRWEWKAGCKPDALSLRYLFFPWTFRRDRDWLTETDG